MPHRATHQHPSRVVSGLQVRILRYIYDGHRRALARVGAASWAQAWQDGVAWQPRGQTRSRSAVISRALARLERRGLVEREAPAGRTVAVRLTALGMSVARHLTVGGADVSR